MTIHPTVALKEYKAEKLLYTMGEVTEMFDVKPSLIRFWEQRFDILKPKKNKKGNRLFTPADVKNLEIIYHLTKERGMTLSGVEKYLKNNLEGAGREAEIARRLQTVRSLLVEIREELKEDLGDETNVFSTDEPESEVATETKTDTPDREDTAISSEEPETTPEPEIPNPLEFTEEVLPGEVTEEEEGDFWEEKPDESPEPEDKHTEAEEPGPEEYEGYPDETDSFAPTAETSGFYEPEAVEWEEDVLDEAVSVPFTAQPLFELEEAEEPAPDSAGKEPQTDENNKPAPVDTQQSLF